jgi:hypothetical protein
LHKYNNFFKYFARNFIMAERHTIFESVSDATVKNTLGWFCIATLILSIILIIWADYKSKKFNNETKEYKKYSNMELMSASVLLLSAFGIFGATLIKE